MASATVQQIFDATRVLAKEYANLAAKAKALKDRFDALDGTNLIGDQDVVNEELGATGADIKSVVSDLNSLYSTYDTSHKAAIHKIIGVELW